MMDSSLRTLRDRQAAWDGSLDRARRKPPDGASRVAVQIYNGGSMGSTGGIYYLGHPVQFNGIETEGGTAMPVVDTSTSVVVDVLGHAPSVGDILTAFAVGGRWVAERGGTSGDSCCGLACSPCTIPRKDLTISWTNPLEGNGSDTLVYNPSDPSWATGCSGGAGVGNQLLFKLFCSGGQIDLRVYYFVSGSCPTGQSNYCSNLRTQGSQLILGSHTCSPLSLEFTSTTLSCPTLTSAGFISYTISDSSPVSGPVMCQRFNLACCGTVSVYTSSGGTLLATSSTNTGSVSLSWSGVPGTYWVVLNGIGTNFTDYGQNLVLGCNGVTNLFPALTVAGTRTFTDSITGTCTMSLVAGSWTGTIDYAYPGGIIPIGPTPCNPSTVTILYQIDMTQPGCHAYITYYYQAPTTTDNFLCPFGGPVRGGSNGVATLIPENTSQGGSRTIACSPFEITWVAPNIIWDGNVNYFLYLSSVPITWTFTP